MPVPIGLITYLTASASITALAILLAFSKRSFTLGPSLLLACIVSASWAAIVAFSTVLTWLPGTLVQLSELLRNASWLFVLLQLLGLQSSGTAWLIGGWHWRRSFFAASAAALTLIAVQPLLPAAPFDEPGFHYQLVLILWLAVALTGLVIIEQLYRNATQSARWSIKFLCLGLGALFAYDFFMYAEALLFRDLDAELWQARGLVNALVIPLLAVAISRISNWQVGLHVSRQVAFHTVTITGAGLYLLGMAAAGFAIRYLGGTWGSMLQMGFMAAAAALLAILLFSGKLRSEIRVFLNKHFYSYRYDYREEWLKFTLALANLNDNVAEGIIRIMAPLTSSPAGLLWGGDDGQAMHLLAHWEMPPPPAGSTLGRLPEWLQQADWVIDLQEWRRSSDLYKDLELPEWLHNDDQLWLVIPLVFRDQVQAVLMLKKSSLKNTLNWEDRDLLKTTGRQAATHLAQHLASEALVEARQFDAFNRLSAYVIHDLKNILAQQSLIVSNAAKHRDNPEFISDMINTVDNSVKRMKRLMEQMRSGIRSTPNNLVPLPEILHQVIAERASGKPVPRADFQTDDAAKASVTPAVTTETSDECVVEADRDRLATVFNHLIQNAQEATNVKGQVVVRLRCSADLVTVDIEDSGTGMSTDFVRDRLFRPFESTKGLTGMGIGAFESREYIRQLGGDIRVDSTPGEGTTFYVTIPRRTGGFPAPASGQQNLSHQQTTANPVQSAATPDMPIGNEKSET
ncbi:MAG: PEP-CTERM system histidine kinase PrsK [Gammaproteobacteria bacterium]